MRKLWERDEDEYLIYMYQECVPAKKIADKLKRTEKSIRTRATKLNIQQGHTLEYKEIKHKLDSIERENKKTRAARLSRQAIIQHLENPEFAKESSKRLKKQIETIGHPKGMLGKNHTEKTREKFSKRMIKDWKDKGSSYNSESCRQKKSDLQHQKMIGSKQSNPYSRTKSGKRKDLNNLFVRSSWEANYARYLNFLKEKGHIHKWEYEPDVFIFEEIKRGTRSYTPDFKIWEEKYSEPYYVEVKGWMDDKSKTKLKRMSKYYPNIKIELVQQKEYNELKKKVSAWIKEWE